MVIGKDKQRIKELEDKVENLTKELESVKQDNADIKTKIKELAQTFENLVDGGGNKTPQQLLREWFTGEESNE